MEKDVIVEEAMKELNRRLKEFKGTLDHLDEEDRDKITNIIYESFMAGLNYGINKAKEIATLH